MVPSRSDLLCGSVGETGVGEQHAVHAVDLLDVRVAVDHHVRLPAAKALARLRQDETGRPPPRRRKLVQQTHRDALEVHQPSFPQPLMGNACIAVAAGNVDGRELGELVNGIRHPDVAGVQDGVHAGEGVEHLRPKLATLGEVGIGNQAYPHGRSCRCCRAAATLLRCINHTKRAKQRSNNRHDDAQCQPDEVDQHGDAGDHEEPPQFLERDGERNFFALWKGAVDLAAGLPQQHSKPEEQPRDEQADDGERVEDANPHQRAAEELHPSLRFVKRQCDCAQVH